MIKAVLFDFDGTLADTNEIILNSWRTTFKKYRGRECRDEEVLGTFGEVLDDTIDNLFPEFPHDEVISVYREYQKYHFYDDVKIYPGMKELVLGLREKGYKLAIVTSRIKSTTLLGLEKFGLKDAFDYIVTCDDTDAHKPSPIPCQIALDKLGVAPDEAIMLGDSKLDIQCAHNAGVRAVMVGWTICAPEEVRTGNSKPDYVIDSADQLFDIIK